MQRHFRALVVEDEHDVLELIQLDLRKLGNITIEAIATTLGEAERILYETSSAFDLTILDIQLDKLCFDLIDKFDRYLFGTIVFITAYDYQPSKELQRKLGLHARLEKPVNTEDWRKVSQNLNWNITVSKNIDQNLTDLLIPIFTIGEGYGGAAKREDHEIVAIETDKTQKCTIVHCIDSNKNYSSLRSSLQLKEFEQLRTAPRFKRIHKQFILNLDYLDYFEEVKTDTVGEVFLKVPFKLNVVYSTVYITIPKFKRR
ncbi:MAG: response regulator transcription factor [Bacteroidetes bacterium]|nr:response regulator transcription factor [Bacteroidota bacterium]